MAQWRGQFSDLTHGSKLAAAEAALRAAIAAFRTAPPAEAEGKAKAVRRLAARVLNLRVKLLKAHRNAQGPVCNETAERWQAPERAALAAGLTGILMEFAAADAQAPDVTPGGTPDRGGM